MTGGESWYWDKVMCEAEGKDFREMWDTSERGDWLLWLSIHMIGRNGWPTHHQVVSASCQCARLALMHVKSGEARPVKAIEMAEAWVRGQATLEEVRAVGHAADYMDHDDAAYCAAQAATSAAQAVCAEEDGSCFRLAYVASDAAKWAAWAASYGVFAAHLQVGEFGPTAEEARDLAEKTTLRECANIVRRILRVPNEWPGPGR